VIELTPQISLLEVLYCLGGLAGFLYALRWTIHAEEDKNGLLRYKLNGGRMLAAKINVAIGWVMLIKLGIYTIAAIVAMSVPPAGDDGDTITWQSTVIGLVFLTAEYLAVYLLRYLNSKYDEMSRYFDTASRDAAEHLSNFPHDVGDAAG
jgi:hypothetical protein